MQNNAPSDEKSKLRQKKESEIIIGADKSLRRTHKTVFPKNVAVHDKFTERRIASHIDASSTSSFSSKLGSHSRLTSSDLTESNVAFIKRTKSDVEGNSVMRTNSKVQVNSITKTGKNSDDLIADGKKNISCVNAPISKKSQDQSVKFRSMKTYISSSKAGGTSKEMAYDIKEKKVNFKGGGRSTEHLKTDSRIQTVCATNSQFKKSNLVKNTNIVRDHNETKKNITELKADKKENKIYEKKNDEKSKYFDSTSRPRRNISGRQTSIANEARQNVISGQEKKSRDGNVVSGKVSSVKVSSGKVSSDKVSSVKVSSGKVSSGKVSSDKVSSVKVSSGKVSSGKVSSAKVPSTTSSSITGSVESVMSRKINGKGRVRTRTWTISSTSGDNSMDHLIQQVEEDFVDKDSKVCRSMEGDSLQNEEKEYIDSEREGRAQVSGSVLKNIREDTRKSIRDVHATKEIHKVNDEKVKNPLAIYNENINVVENIDTLEEEYVYEDDFEDYESDFEECSDEEDDAASNSHSSDSCNSDCGNESTKQFDEGKIMAEKMEENWRQENHRSSDAGVKDNYEDGEKKMDSGLYDSGGRRRQEGDVALLKMPRVDADEGFDEREEAVRHSGKNLGMKMVLDCPSRGCINCEIHTCKRKPLTKEEVKKVYRRGKQLLEMITLDEISYSLFELPPIPYDVFMRSHGHLDTKQISVQTNEDALCESVQTNLIIKCDAWTQKPPVLGSSGAVDEDVLSCALDAASWKHLRRFVELAGEVMVIMLEEQWNDFKAVKKECLPSTVFSRFSVELGHDGSSSMFWKSLFTSRPVCSIRFCETQTNLLVCAHGSLNSELETYQKNNSEDKAVANGLEAISESSLLSLWSVNEPSHPLSLLSCQGNISTTCFGGYFNRCGQLMFAGTDVGTIYLWDLHVKGGSCKKIFVNGGHREPVVCPTFSTSGGETHLGRIVGLEAVVDSKCYSEDTLLQVEMTNQVCSLDEWGTVVIWSVIMMGGVLLRSVGLVASMQLCLASILEKQTMVSHSKNLIEVAKQRPSCESPKGSGMWNSLAVDHNCILAASDTGDIVCLPLDGDNRSIQVYPASKDSFASAECLAANPQGLPFFLVGNSMGQVCLYSHNSARRFASWEVSSTLVAPCAVASVAWSPQRPFVFFTVDILSRMTIWDLSSSDIFPFATVSPPQDGKITALSLSFCKENAPAYMAIGMDHGQVILHQLKEELNSKNGEMRGQEVSQFLKYANHL